MKIRNLILSFLCKYKMLPPMPEDKNDLLKNFITTARAMDNPRVLELGTLRSIEDRSTMHKDWVPNASEYIGTDIEDCVDVDVVADVHSLSTTLGEESFDIVISCSTFEHFKYPQLAAHEIMKVLKLNGILFIQTHQSFPLHAYPFDYYRFSKEALCGLFSQKMGFKTQSTCYNFPAWIYSQRDPQSVNAHSYLNVCLHTKKLIRTPSDYVYDI